MNKMTLAILMMLMMLSVSPVALGATGDEDPGVTPDSFLWGIDKALDQIGLLLARSPEGKVEKGLEIAQERLLEVKAMAEENKLDAAGKAEEAHGKILLKVKESIQELDDDDPESLLDREIEIEGKLKRYDDYAETVRTELKVKIKIEGTLTAEQQKTLDDFLASLSDDTDEIKLEIKEHKKETKIKIIAKTGKSETELEEEIEEKEREEGVLEDDREVQAHIIGERAQVRIKYDFDTRTTDRDALIDEMVERFSLDSSEVDAILELVDEDENDDWADRLRIKAEIRDDVAEVEMKLWFSLNSSERGLIAGAVVERTLLTRADIEDALELKSETGDEEIEVKVEIEDSRAKVKIELGDEDSEFFLDTADKEAILQEIASRLDVPVDAIRDLVKFEEEDGTETPDDDGTDEEEEEQSEAEVSVEDDEAGEDEEELSVEVTERKFEVIARQSEFVPATLEVNLNDKVEIHITSADVAHGFSLPAFGISETIEAGKDITVEFVADKSGSFPFRCVVPCGPGHGGMTGVLVVS